MPGEEESSEPKKIKLGIQNGAAIDPEAKVKPGSSIVSKGAPVLDVTHAKKIILVTRLDSMGHLLTVNCANVTVTSPRVPRATATLRLESA